MTNASHAGGVHIAAHDTIKAEPSEAGPAASWNSAPWPAGMKVLVVDDDPVCLMVVSQMLQKCNYKATTAVNGKSALDKLRSNPDDFDLVISDVYMPDMDGFKLLEHVNFELKLPVIMMSGNGTTDVVLRGVTHGAVDFLIKPVRLEELRNAWQHVVRRKRIKAAGRGDSSEREDEDTQQYNNDRKRKSDDKRKSIDESDGEMGSTKKARVVWSVEMHQQFVAAVNFLGVDKAVPKRILDVMGVAGLTRENVASHLQKYRLYLRKMNNSSGGRGKSACPGMMLHPHQSQMQYYQQQDVPQGVALAHHTQRPQLGMSPYRAAPGFPMDLSIQQQSHVLGGMPDQLVRMQMRSLHLQSPRVSGGVHGHLGGSSIPTNILGGTAITSGLEYGAAPEPTPMQMPLGPGMAPSGIIQTADISGMPWLPAVEPALDGHGRELSSPLGSSSADGGCMPAMEVTAGNTNSRAEIMDLGHPVPQEGTSSSSARESTVAAGNCLLKPYGLQAEADASLAAHFSQPLMATPCSDFRADVLTPTAGSALRLDDDLDDDTAFGQSLLNPELFGDPLPLSNLPHLSSSESHQGSTAQLHQTDPSEFVSQYGPIAAVGSTLGQMQHDGQSSTAVPNYSSLPERDYFSQQDVFAVYPMKQLDPMLPREQRSQRPPFPMQSRHQQPDGGKRDQHLDEQVAMCDNTAEEQQHQQSMDDMLKFFLKDSRDDS